MAIFISNFHCQEIGLKDRGKSLETHESSSRGPLLSLPSLSHAACRRALTLQRWHKPSRDLCKSDDARKVENQFVNRQIGFL